jgi:hypothetical protein
MEIPSPDQRETFNETVAASDSTLIRLQKLLLSSQAIVDATRLRIRDSRRMISDANALRDPAAHPVQSREGFLPTELALAA